MVEGSSLHQTHPPADSSSWVLRIRLRLDLSPPCLPMPTARWWCLLRLCGTLPFFASTLVFHFMLEGHWSSLARFLNFSIFNSIWTADGCLIACLQCCQPASTLPACHNTAGLPLHMPMARLNIAGLRLCRRPMHCHCLCHYAEAS